MKHVVTLLLATGLLLGASTDALTVDFRIKGQWLMGFAGGEDNLVAKTHAGQGKRSPDGRDAFAASQRLQLQLDAAASENLSGTLFVEIGKTQFGGDARGGALGADSVNAMKLKDAYLDWAVPSTDLKFRMGIQYLALPNKAGGSAVFDADVAGIDASYKFNDNVSLTALWMRPFNDNYTAGTEWRDNANHANYLDNMDLFTLSLPMKFEGIDVNPWVMYGMRGKNTGKFAAYQENGLGDGMPSYTFGPYPAINGYRNIGNTSKAYGNMFWVGLPFAVIAWAPLYIELDLNYGFVESMGRYDAIRNQGIKHSNTQREGWLVKALVEYKTDWGAPGIFGWYASGDDGNPGNGSKRMPTIVPYGNFTSFLGDGNMYWAPGYNMIDQITSYSGTWGIGARIKDVSFVEKLKDSLTVAWWGGTNSPAMVKYMRNAWDWNTGFMENYLTTNDGLLEVNFTHEYQMYENFKINLELAYVGNFMDNNTWNKAGAHNTSFERQDMWKAQLVFVYSF